MDGAMKSRGFFSFIKDTPAYKDSEKNWYVELADYTVFWFDLMINSPPGIDFQKVAAEYLKDYRDAVKESNDKRFVYFIAARQKVRFSTRKSPKYSLTKREIIIYLEIGKKRTVRKLRFLASPSLSGRRLPIIVDNGRFISIWGSDQSKPVGVSVHEFLMGENINIGIDTEILYVGSTDAPATRPLKRDHRGYSDSLYDTPTDERDIFVYYNLFKATSVTQSNPYLISFAVSNSAIDEVQKMEEGILLEHGLIHYFGTKSQEKSKTLEYGRLREGLRRLSANYKIESVTYYIQAATPTEYWHLYSRQVPVNHRHNFSLSLAGEEVLLGEPVEL
ncbi:Hypothetical protein PflQ2_0579 [Pseudomonas fluorescens Q2-87]|uniref:Uncharacterized protein n=2 Tax=Pseudomonas fluorescens TaxID=294 RepID=J2E826_PSEFQ|nr:Hypothetical protein PflQ2_0579 [Pseudomonas fluorescens Q2-87]